MKLRKLSVALGASAVAVAALGAIPALGADHRDSPLTKTAARTDLTDVYVFKGTGAGVVLAMGVNGLTSPADTPRLSLDPDAVYEFKLDTDGDAKADVSYKLTASGAGPVQDITLRRATQSDAVTDDPSGAVVATGKSSTASAVTTIALPDGGKLFVGPREDPFFFDLAGLQAGLKFTGTDTFKGTNITAVVLELAQAPATKFGVWSTTSKRGTLGNWEQIDRMGRPGIATLFIPEAKKDAFNTNNPDRDVSIYTADVKASLNSLKSPATDTLAGLLLPDILTVDLSKPIGYLNGRALADDVIDISLQAVTGDPKATDMVNANDATFSTSFPYYAAPFGAAAPGAPNTGTGIASTSDSMDWTLPAGLAAAGVLLAAAGVVNRRKGNKAV